ncbi:MAG: hypothetical protein H6753_05620 [Candidatus Omnitrophica bacterium]|nr:hypothetical protein [Candidatus Omnitrophota bacterium]
MKGKYFVKNFMKKNQCFKILVLLSTVFLLNPSKAALAQLTQGEPAIFLSDSLEARGPSEFPHILDEFKSIMEQNTSISPQIQNGLKIELHAPSYGKKESADTLLILRMLSAIPSENITINTGDVWFELKMKNIKSNEEFLGLYFRKARILWSKRQNVPVTFKGTETNYKNLKTDNSNQ